MNLIQSKIKQKERATLAFALVAPGCGFPHDGLVSLVRQNFCLNPEPTIVPVVLVVVGHDELALVRLHSEELDFVNFAVFVFLVRRVTESHVEQLTADIVGQIVVRPHVAALATALATVPQLELRVVLEGEHKVVVHQLKSGDRLAERLLHCSGCVGVATEQRLYHYAQSEVAHGNPPYVSGVWFSKGKRHLATIPNYYSCLKYSKFYTICQERQKSPYFRLFFMNLLIKNFSVPQIQNMVRADVSLRVLLRFLSVRLRRISDFSRGAFLAAAGGENRPNYFKNRPHFRKGQGFGSRLASLGGHFVFNFGGKNELAVSFVGRKNF